MNMNNNVDFSLATRLASYAANAKLSALRIEKKGFSDCDGVIRGLRQG